MTFVELKAQSRTELGKCVKRLRKSGFLPAVLYGERISSQPIMVVYRDFEKVYREAGESTLVTLTVDGTPYNVLINDIAHDPLKGNPTHADFYAVRMDKVIRTRVPVAFFGESEAVKNEGGVLVKVMQEMEIEALPQDLPREVRVNCSLLTQIGSRIMVRDITFSRGVKTLVGGEDIVVLVEAPRAAEELDVQAPVAVAEVVTEQEAKRAAKKEEVAKESVEGQGTEAQK